MILRDYTKTKTLEVDEDTLFDWSCAMEPDKQLHNSLD
jgi:hypothetical protein